MRTTKTQFLSESDGYGYENQQELPRRDGKDRAATEDPRNLLIDHMRASEFPQLQDTVYLDHGGATLYAASQLQHSMTELQSGVFGNPHSHSPLHTNASDESTASRIAAIRRRVLAHFNAAEDEYAVVLTSGATAALKMVGETFPWSSDSSFVHSMDSHTSVLGIRACAKHRGGHVRHVALDEMQRLQEQAQEPSRHDRTVTVNEGPCHLFSFPAECNFSGTLHGLELIKYIQQHGVPSASTRDGRWLVLLDAAKFVATHTLDLQIYKPDFVALSFYKMFGYPTGVGALLVHRQRALPLLQKRYYGGGTVANVIASSDFVKLRDLTDPARLEDGTASFLSILALRHGFDTLDRLTMKSIENHTTSLVRLLRSELQALKHWNGVSVAQVYGDDGGKGSIVSFNFRRFDGSYVGYAEVGKLAAIHNIHLRTGCFCNPGACQWYLGLQESDLMESMAAGHVCGDDVDLVNGRPTGAVRLSVGYMSSYEDIETFIAFTTKYFVACSAPTVVPPQPVMATPGVVLRKLVLFPIKSCAGMSVDAWPVGSRGLLYDREWAILDAATRKALTLKDAPEMCFLEPVVDLQRQTLTINCRKSSSSYVLPLYATLASTNKDEDAQEMRVCAAPCKGRDVGDEASEWLSQRLQRSCRLVRVAAESARSATPSFPTTAPTSSNDKKIGFANQAQFLLISRASVAHVNASLAAAGAAMQIREDAFRANLIVDLSAHAAFAEDTWSRLRIGDVVLDVTGPCSRCSMVNIDPVTGAFHRAPLQVLSRYRRARSQIFFGQFLSLRNTDHAAGEEEEEKGPKGAARVAWLHCGTSVDVEVCADSSLLKPL